MCERETWFCWSRRDKRQPITPVTPITAPAPAEIPRMSLPPVAVEILPEVPVSGAEQPPPLRRSGRATRRPKTLGDYVLY